MKLSLILPVYNVSKYIIRCLDSIVPQLTEEIEVVIIDDASPDDSIAKAAPYSIKFSNIKIVHQDNRGLGGARNTGIKESSGDYIWFIDSDDKIEPNVLSLLLSKIDGEDIVIFDNLRINAKGESSRNTYKDELLHKQGWEIEKHFLLSQAWRSFYKREFLIDNKLYFREHYLHEDGEFNMRAMCLATNVSYYPVLGYHYYTENGGSIMNTIKMKNFYDLMKEFDTLKIMQETYSINSKQTCVLYNHVMLAVTSMWSKVPLLNDSCMPEYRLLLKKYRNQIRLVVKNINPNIKTKIIYFICMYLPYKKIYNLIYNKKL